MKPLTIWGGIGGLQTEPPGSGGVTQTLARVVVALFPGLARPKPLTDHPLGGGGGRRRLPPPASAAHPSTILVDIWYSENHGHTYTTPRAQNKPLPHGRGG